MPYLPSLRKPFYRGGTNRSGDKDVIDNISTTFAKAKLHLEQDMQAVGVHVNRRYTH